MVTFDLESKFSPNFPNCFVFIYNPIPKFFFIFSLGNREGEEYKFEMDVYDFFCKRLMNEKNHLLLWYLLEDSLTMIIF